MDLILALELNLIFSGKIEIVFTNFSDSVTYLRKLSMYPGP